MIDRLNWMLAKLQRLEDNERVRGEGLADFRAVKNELVDVIATYTEPVAPPPAIVNQVFGPGELDALIVGVAEQAKAGAEEGSEQLVAMLRGMVAEESEKSDVAVLAAIAETRADVLAAVAPAA